MNTTIKVEGMECEHCVAAVKKALTELPGVSGAQVDLDKGTVEVTYDESAVEIKAMNEAIEEQGYDVIV